MKKNKKVLSKHRIEIHEKSVLNFMVKYFPLQAGLKNFLVKYFKLDLKSDLLLSNKFIYSNKKILRSYFTDREKLLMAINLYRLSHFRQDLLTWLDETESAREKSMAHMILSIMYISDLLEMNDIETYQCMVLLHLNSMDLSQFDERETIYLFYNMNMFFRKRDKDLRIVA